MGTRGTGTRAKTFAFRSLIHTDSRFDRDKPKAPHIAHHITQYRIYPHSCISLPAQLEFDKSCTYSTFVSCACTEKGIANPHVLPALMPRNSPMRRRCPRWPLGWPPPQSFDPTSLHSKLAYSIFVFSRLHVFVAQLVLFAVFFPSQSFTFLIIFDCCKS